VDAYRARILVAPGFLIGANHSGIGRGAARCIDLYIAGGCIIQRG